MIDEYVKLINVVFIKLIFAVAKIKQYFKMSPKTKRRLFIISFCTPSGTRTLDPLIKSQLLYQLS